MQVDDEHGTTWHVEAGDPARQHANALKRLGCRWIVLPRCVILTGARIEEQPPLPDSATADVRAHYIRMEDCLVALV